MRACPSTRNSWGGSCAGMRERYSEGRGAKRAASLFALRSSLFPSLPGRALAHHFRARPGEFRPGGRGHPEPGEAELALEEDLRAIAGIDPLHDPHVVARRRLHGLIGLAEGEVDLPTIGAPSRPALVLEAFVGDRDPGEVLIQRLVLRRRRLRIGGGPELPPEAR